uniref:Pentatricopeptide repeat-containing protein n=1 Tax=Kalanchoe fedtschenkoi TaxID=63787 RepID=A0A7N0UJB7_KALFE
MYGSFGRVSDACKVFDLITQPDFFAYKVMIRWYFMYDLYEEIMVFFRRLRKCLREHDNVVFSIVLKACRELCEFNEGRKVHGLIVKVGGPDSFVLTGLVDMYGKSGDVEDSRRVFDGIVERNVVCWSSMIAGYVQNGCPEEGLVLFNRMREGLVEGNQVTLGSLVCACTKLRASHQGKWLHGYVVKYCFDVNSYLGTSLVDFYAKCVDVRDARLVFDELGIVDLYIWTAMIVGYTQRAFPIEALKLFTGEKWKGLTPSSVTVASVLSACGQSGELSLGRSVHGMGVMFGWDCNEDPAMRNALVDMYSKCHLMEDARIVFEEFADRDLIAWNSIISGYAQNGSACEALELFGKMRLDFFSPDAVTVVSALSACASGGLLRVGSSLHAFSMKEGLLSANVYVGTALLNLYAKCGDAKSARLIFDAMKEKNTITWSAMIGGYGVQGDGSNSLALFDNMLSEEVEPNEAIFTTLLSACSHAGLVGEGRRYFNSMCRDFNFVPKIKHYACMVDILARAGRLEEALYFINSMPLKPEVGVFSAFLHGCSVHSKFELGDEAIKKMLDLHPDEACYYVLISNFYAMDGRWSLANQIRNLMKQKGLDKSPGHSFVDIKSGGNHVSPLKVASYA